MRKFLEAIRDDQRGAAAIEYGMLAVLIGVGLMGVLMSTGDGVEAKYDDVATKYTAANNV
ncbi:Flp family type IVb pilin [Altererythrobacter sp. CAU 1778]